MAFNRIFKITNLTFILLLTTAMAFSAFGQGRGRGGGGGHGGGNGHGNGGGGVQMPRGGQGNGRWGGQPAPQQRMQMPQMRQMPQARQMPQIRQMPQMRQTPQIRQMPQVRQMPQMQNRGWAQRQQRPMIVQQQPRVQQQPQNRGWDRRQQQIFRQAERQASRPAARQSPVFAQPLPGWNRQAKAGPPAGMRQPGRGDWKFEQKAEKRYLKEIRREQRETARMPRYQAPDYSAPRWQTQQQRYAGSYSYPEYQYRSYSPQVYQSYRYVPQNSYSYSPQYYDYGYAPQYDYGYGYTPQYYGGTTYVYESYLPYAYRPAYVEYEPYYYDEFVNYGRHTSWKYRLLAMVLQAFLGGRDDFGFYDPYSGSQYAYYGEPYRNPSRYNPSRYISYSSYDSYAYDPYDYGNDSDIGLLDIVPYFGLSNQVIGGFGNEITIQTMSYGYDQGYYAGQYCRRQNIDGDDFYDPYYYEDAGYDPYSLSIAENRRYLSEGYQLGFRDGYNAARRDYDPMQYGDVDLVSLMLNNVLSVM